MPLKCRKIRSHLTGKIKLRKRLRNLTKNPHSFKFNENSLHAIKIIWPLWLPLRFWLLFQGEGTYQKKLDVITFPLSSSNRGYRRFNGRTTSSKQKALVCPKTAKRAKLNYTYRLPKVYIFHEVFVKSVTVDELNIRSILLNNLWIFYNPWIVFSIAGCTKNGKCGCVKLSIRHVQMTGSNKNSDQVSL